MSTGLIVDERAPQPSVLADVGAKVGLALGATLIGVVLLELLVRMFAPQLLYRYPKGLFVNDPVTGYRLAPGFSGPLTTVEFSTWLRVDMLGLRDSREFGPKAPGTRRILLLGDSFAMGYGVDESQTFARLVEDRLNVAAGRAEFTVLNSGVPGYDTRQEIDFLRDRGFAMEPDAVVLAFFIGNDVVDNADRDRRYRVVDGYLTSGDPQPGVLPVGVRSFLARNSHLYQFVSPIERRIRGIPAAKTEDPLFRCGFEVDDASWGVTENLLAGLSKAVRDRGVPLFIVVIPDMVQVEPELWAAASHGRRGFDPSHPDRKLLAVADARAVPVLDLYPPLKAAPETETLYFPIDHHFTQTGNRVAADAIAPFLWEHLQKPL
jgi:lysophospholipase L1-like esterase